MASISTTTTEENKKNAAREGEGSKKQKTALLLSTECPLSFTQFQCSAVALLFLLLLPRVVLPLPSGRVKADNSCQKAMESRKEMGEEREPGKQREFLRVDNSVWNVQLSGEGEEETKRGTSKD